MDPLLSPLLISVGVAGAKFLAKSWVGGAAASTGLMDGDLAGELAGGLVDCFKDRIKDVRAQRKAARLFEEIGDKIADCLRPTFEQAIKSGQISVQDVTGELVKTLEARVSAEFLVQVNLDPARLTTALRDARPVEQGTFNAAELVFYYHALEEAVRYLVSTASTLPRFQEAFVAESLSRLSHIDEDLDKVLEATERIERRVVGTTDDAAARFEADYRHAVTRNLDYLELFGVDLPPEARRHALSVAYVSLNLQGNNGEDGAFQSVESVLSGLSSNGGRLLVRGEAGGGKSTLFRWAAMQAADATADIGGYSFGSKSVPDGVEVDGSFSVADHAQTVSFRAKLAKTNAAYWGLNTITIDESKGIDLGSRDKFLRNQHWKGRIPFLIRLRDCASGKLPSPDEFPELIAKQAGHPPRGWVRDVLTSGRGFVLLDGVDEIPGEFRDATLYGEIDAIVKAFPENYFLVSTRPEAVQEGWLAGMGFREARINPMSNTDKSQFIDKWHEAVEQELAKRGVSSAELSLERLANELKEKLAESPSINRLATNPLMCAMICALHRERRQKLPESQSELVEALCHMLLHRRELESGLQLDAFPKPYRNLTYPHKKLIVQDLAYHMVVKKQESVIARGDAERLMQERLERIGGKTEDAAVVLRTLAERSGMLREAAPKTAESPGTLDFVHNTFKEYLAGIRLAEEGADGELASNAARPEWLHVILFAVAVEKRDFATSVIQKILGASYQPDKVVRRTRIPKGQRRKKLPQEEVEAQHRLLMALRCSAVALDLAPKLRTWLDKQLKRLFPPRSMVEAEALAFAGDLAVPFLKKLRGGARSAACIRALRLIGTETAQRTLRLFLDDANSKVVEELSQAMNPLSIPAVQRMVQEPFGLPGLGWQSSIRRQIVDLSPLAEFEDVRSLNLSGSQVSSLSQLSDLTALTTLSLSHTPVSDLSPLMRLNALTFLDLNTTKATDLSPLQDLVSLETLNLGGMAISHLGPLAALIRLKNLDLNTTMVSDLAPLADLENLISLDLGGTQVSDVTPLADLVRLTSLDLRHTLISDVSPLAGLSHLRVLDLFNTPVTDLAPLDGARNLVEIRIGQDQSMSIPKSLVKALRRF